MLPAMSILEFLFGKPGPTTADKFKQTSKDMGKAARKATRREETRLEDAHEFEIEAKNMLRKGRRDEARRLLRKSARTKREAVRFTKLAINAEKFQSLTEALELSNDLMSGQRNMGQLARRVAPPGREQAAPKQAMNVEYMQQVVDDANTAFEGAMEHGKDADSEDEEEAEGIEDLLNLWDQEDGRIVIADNPRQQRDASVDAFMAEEEAKMNL